MSNNSIPLDELDEILAAVHEELEGGASADRVMQIATSCPHLREEILAFAAEWFASDGSDLPDDALGAEWPVSKPPTEPMSLSPLGSSLDILAPNSAIGPDGRSRDHAP